MVKVLARLAHDPRPLTLAELTARCNKMREVWPTLSPEKQQQWAGLHDDLLVAEVVAWAFAEPEQLPLDKIDNTCYIDDRKGAQ